MATGKDRPRRADAVANGRRIVEAAVTCLSRDPGASVSRIAQEAGVGRVTLYGHFPSREALVEAAMVQILADGEVVLSGIDLDGDPIAALSALIESSWQLVADGQAVLEAAEESLPPGRVQELHARPADRLAGLIRRGQVEGVLRDDLPTEWMVSSAHHLIHGAAADVRAGRIDETDAPRLITSTVVAAFATGR